MENLTIKEIHTIVNSLHFTRQRMERDNTWEPTRESIAVSNIIYKLEVAKKKLPK